LKPLIFLPGLGADARPFRHQKKVFKHFRCPPWLEPKTRESLAGYARRWAGVLNLKPKAVLVGVSFGGMVAQEMARWVKPSAVILIGSCRSCESIPKSLKAAAMIPDWPQTAKILCRVFPEISGRFLGARTKEEGDLLRRMFLETPNDFARWTVQSIFQWKGVPKVQRRVTHIHGAKDHLIPLRRVQPDEVVREGGHLICLTHPMEVNRFIQKTIG
jgi:pimeloyl-ACP methyl ester carboxylesterase